MDIVVMIKTVVETNGQNTKHFVKIIHHR